MQFFPFWLGPAHVKKQYTELHLKYTVLYLKDACSIIQVFVKHFSNGSVPRDSSRLAHCKSYRQYLCNAQHKMGQGQGQGQVLSCLCCTKEENVLSSWDFSAQHHQQITTNSQALQRLSHLDKRHISHLSCLSCFFAHFPSEFLQRIRSHPFWLFLNRKQNTGGFTELPAKIKQWAGVITWLTTVDMGIREF